MFVNEVEHLNKINSAIDKLKSIKFNDSKDVESKVVNATNDLIYVRDSLNQTINEFDKWATEQSDVNNQFDSMKNDDGTIEPMGVTGFTNPYTKGEGI